MKLLIFGGTGKTGLELIRQGLEQGHIIIAIVRNPDKLKQKDPNLVIVKGNVLDPDSFDKHVKGQDAVLSVLGHKKFFIKTNVLSEGTKNIINSMEKHGVKRLICVTTLGINDSRFKLGLYYTFFTIPLIVLFYFLDKSKQEKLIMQSKLDWTIVRPGQLTDGKLKTDYKHGSDTGSYILTRMISRASVAHFLLGQLNDKSYLHKTPGINN